MRFYSLTVVFVFGRFLGMLKNKAKGSSEFLMWVMISDWMWIWPQVWLWVQTFWKFKSSLSNLREKLVRFMVVRIEHNCSNRVCTWRTGNRPSHAVAQGVSFSIGGQPPPQLALVWRHRDVIVSTSSKRGNFKSWIAHSCKVFVYTRLFSNSY